MTFQLKIQGEFFTITSCPQCDLVIWPPNKICNICFSSTILKKISCIGKILEFSKKDTQKFCLVEFDHDLRVIGSLLDKTLPHEGQKVLLTKCTTKNGSYDFQLKLA